MAAAPRQLLRTALAAQSYGHSQRRHAIPPLMAAAAVSAALVGATVYAGRDGDERQMRVLPLRYPLCQCEDEAAAAATQPIPPPAAASSTSAAPPPLSRTALLLHAAKFYPHSYLRVPRLLGPHDPLFSYPELRRGLVRRRNDEEKVKQILSSPELMEARKNGDQQKLQEMLREMNAVVYGEGVTPQSREDFMAQFGCTGYTDEALEYLVGTFGRRGIVEVGAGNGQWARALSDRYRAEAQKKDTAGVSKSWEFILAYDNMEQLPLSPKVYHQHTVPANKYFHKVHEATHVDAVRNARGRALLLVYPPPGPMALETVRAYLDASPGFDGSSQNDTVVYVGEGRGGANADDAFFDYLLGVRKEDRSDEDSAQWVVDKVMDVRPSPGGKGFEKMFVLRRIP